MKVRWYIAAMLCFCSFPAFGSMVITGTFDDAGMSAAGLSAGQIASVHTAFNFAAAQFMNNFSDPINININVTAVAGTGTLGQSNTFLDSFTYAQLHTALAADSKTAADATALGAGGSIPSVDPASGSHNWWVTTSEAKALGLIANNLTTDGTFTFGAGFTYSFDPANRGILGEVDFIGVAEHEISEIMGRIPGLGTTAFNGTPGYLAFDLFRYTGAGTRSMTAGSGISFSFDNGTTLLKAYNFPNGNGSDPQDWASGTNDAFNAFSSSGVINDMTAVDLQVMDVIGYDASAPEPATLSLFGGGLALLAFVKRFRNRRLAK